MEFLRYPSRHRDRQTCHRDTSHLPPLGQRGKMEDMQNVSEVARHESH